MSEFLIPTAAQRLLQVDDGHIYYDSDGIDVTRLPNGTYVAVWDRDKEIWGQILTADGAQVGPAVLISTAYMFSDGWSYALQASPSVAATADGGFLVAWNVEEDDPYWYTGRDIYTRLYTFDGVATTEPRRTVFVDSSEPVISSSREMNP